MPWTLDLLTAGAVGILLVGLRGAISGLVGESWESWWVTDIGTVGPGPVWE